jgi:hypothetical protein
VLLNGDHVIGVVALRLLRNSSVSESSNLGVLAYTGIFGNFQCELEVLVAETAVRVLGMP